MRRLGQWLVIVALCVVLDVAVVRGAMWIVHVALKLVLR